MKRYTQPDEAFLHQIVDAMPFAAMVVDHDVAIAFANRAAVHLSDPNEEPILHKRSGDALGCINARANPAGCGHSNNCPDCVIRQSIQESFQGQRTTRKKFFLELKRGESVSEVPVLVTATPFDFRDGHYCLLILEDISETVNLQELLPICAQCKKIRDDQNYWHHIEQYMADHVSDLTFTHSLCPDCLSRLYPDHIRRHKARAASLPAE